MPTSLRDITEKSLKRPFATVEFKTFDELNGNTLIVGDVVTLPFKNTTASFAVTDRGLNLSGLDIFAEYKVDGEALARRVYAYRPTMVNKFPECQPGDMEALTRLCLCLYLMADAVPSAHIKMPNRHWKHIDFNGLR